LSLLMLNALPFLSRRVAAVLWLGSVLVVQVLP
jgi:hypothetical protein